jgi:hypothetical protein
MVAPSVQPTQNPFPTIVLPKLNNSLIFLMVNEFRAKRNPLNKRYRRAKSLSHGRPVGGRPPTQGWTTFLATTGGSVTGEVGGRTADWMIETGPEGPH